MRTKCMEGKCEKGCPEKLVIWKPCVKPDILIKCWTLKNSKAQFHGCCVEHMGRVKCIINSSAFKTIMQELRSQVEELWKHHAHVMVACVDGYGCHRARTLAAILTAYYEQRGFDSKGPFRATCKGWWMRYCRMKECEPVKQVTQLLYAAIGDK